MDGPELIARDLALLVTTNPEAFHSALHELTDAIATSAHPDAELLALGAEFLTLGEAIRACPGDAELEHADTRLATVEELIATMAPTTGAGLAVKLRLAWAWWVEDAAEWRGRPHPRQRRPDPAAVAAHRRGRGPGPLPSGGDRPWLGPGARRSRSSTSRPSTASRDRTGRATWTACAARTAS